MTKCPRLNDKTPQITERKDRNYRNMSKRKNSRKKRNGLIKATVAFILVIAAIVYYLFFTAMSRSGESEYLYIDADDNADSVYSKLSPIATKHSLWAFKKLASVKGYGSHIKTGRYQIADEGAFQTFRYIRNGIQAPVNVTINSVRTTERLAKDISKRLMITQDELLAALNDSSTCAQYGYTPKTIMCMFIPNTYDFYWNISVKTFLERMNGECKKFWTFERLEKAKSAGLSPIQVVTLASIVDEETANVDEMPMIAGMYINRLNIDMLLQADPTVKYANGNFEARRIYNSMLRVDNPYNTYKYKGLPPGPIRIPSLQAVEAVLNYVHHEYIYMCAKEDFSGTHNFAKTYSEHMQNAAKYAKALNERGIK